MTAGNPGPVTPDRYAAALGGADPLESMRKAPKRLARLVKGLGERKLSARPGPGKWSPKEVIAHLADGEVMIGSRYRLVAAMERPPLTGYDQDALVEKLFLGAVSTKDLLADFKAARRANVRLLERLPAEVMARVGLHSERGEESLARMLVIYAGHDLLHEAQLAAQIGGAGKGKTKRRSKDGDKAASGAPARSKAEGKTKTKRKDKSKAEVPA